MSTYVDDPSGNHFQVFVTADGTPLVLMPSLRAYLTAASDNASVFYFPVAAALDDAISNPTVAPDASCQLVWNGTNWVRLKGDATNGLLVNLGANNDVTLATLPDTAAGDLAAMVVDLAAIEVLLGTIDTDTGAIASSAASIDTKTPALGQALAAGSVPVVLTAAQITTLTPPAAITGFATEAKQPALGTAGTASSDVITVQGIASMTPILVDGSGVTQPISAASLPLPAGAATQATLATLAGIDFALESGGNLATIAGTDFAVESGGNLATIASAVHAEDAPHTSAHNGVFMLGVRNENDTAFVAGANDYTPIAVTNAGFTLTASSKNEDGQHVDGAWGSFVLTVRKDSGGSTAGTNGDYAAFTTDSGGNLWVRDSIGNGYLQTIDVDTGTIAIATSSCATSLAIMDDWDESDRAKVNLIASQAGITGGAGSVAANTPRMTLASDDPAVAKLTTIDSDTSNLVSSLYQQVGLSPAGFYPVVAGVNSGTVQPLSLNSSGSLDVGIATAALVGISEYGSGSADSDLAVTNSVQQFLGGGTANGGTLHWLHVYNPNSSVVYLQLFFLESSSVTLGTTTPKMSIPILPYSVWEHTWTRGLPFINELSYAATTTSTGNTAPASNLILNGSGDLN